MRFILLLQILDTIFKQTNKHLWALHLTETDISLQSCRFDTQFTAMLIETTFFPDFHDINLRMTQSSFTLNTSDESIKIIHFQIQPRVSWMLRETEFQTNFYHAVSSDKNFTKELNGIVSYAPLHTYDGIISETPYASGNITLNLSLLKHIHMKKSDVILDSLYLWIQIYKLSKNNPKNVYICREEDQSYM